MSTITPATFDAKKLSVSDVKKLDNGSSQVYLNYDGKRLRVQAPRLPVPMDASDYQDNKKYKVQLSFRDRHSNPKVAAYVKMLEDIDNFIIDQATKNSGKWFKMPGASREMIGVFYTPSIKIAKDKDGNPKDYPPTQALNLKQRNGAFDTELYDDKKQLMEGVTPLDVLRRGSEVTPISEVTGIWIADKKFGTTWKLHQARIDVPGEGDSSRGFLGVDDEDSAPVVSKRQDADLIAAVMPSKAAPAPAPAPVEEEEEEKEDSTDDVEEDEVVKPVPVPKKVVAAPAAAAEPVKKVVKKVVAKK